MKRIGYLLTFAVLTAFGLSNDITESRDNGQRDVSKFGRTTFGFYYLGAFHASKSSYNA